MAAKGGEVKVNASESGNLNDTSVDINDITARTVIIHLIEIYGYLEKNKDNEDLHSTIEFCGSRARNLNHPWSSEFILFQGWCQSILAGSSSQGAVLKSMADHIVMSRAI